MLIIEGPDNSGKTTLVKELAQLLPGQKVLHSGGPVKSEADRDERMERILNSRHVIWDRVPCISEQIYGPVLRGVNIFGGTTYLQAVVDIGAAIIYCRPPDHLLFNLDTHDVNPDHDDEEHLTGIKQNHEKIVASYDYFMRHIPHLRYDYYNMTMAHKTLFIGHIIMVHRINEKERGTLANER